MGLLNDLPNNAEAGDSRSAEYILREVTHNLRDLQQSLVVQLNQDVGRLQAEKSRLLTDIEQLQSQYQTLHSQQQFALSQQQIEQQQIWAKQMAQALANHLQSQLVQRVNQMGRVPSNANFGLMGSPPAPQSREAEEVLASIDSSLNKTLNSLRQDLNTYQSSLSQQIGRMHNLQQQGEVILEVLVSRLSQQLQSDVLKAQANSGRAAFSPDTPPAPTYGNGSHNGGQNGGNGSGTRTASLTPPAVAQGTPPPPPKPKHQMSAFQKGLMTVLGSTLALSLHNVVVGIIGFEGRLFNVNEVGGFIDITTLGNSLLLLWLRMILVMPLLALFAGMFYDKTWQDVRRFLESNDRRLMLSVVGSGAFLFLSQLLIYVAIGGVGPGVAVTILFMYPLITAPLAWILFGDRPTPLRVLVMIAIASGVVLTLWPKVASTDSVEGWGVLAAVISGIAFACYMISMQISFRKLHPVPVSLIQFSTIFLLTSLSLLLPRELGIAVEPDGRTGLFIGWVLLGVLTLTGYLLNNLGVKFMGASQASVIAASGPALTALLAAVITPSANTALEIGQIVGILVVSLGVASLSVEKLLMQNRKTSS